MEKNGSNYENDSEETGSENELLHFSETHALTPEAPEKLIHALLEEITAKLLRGEAKNFQEIKAVIRDFPVHKDIKHEAQKHIKTLREFMEAHHLTFKSLVVFNDLPPAFIVGKRPEGRFCQVTEYRNMSIDTPDVDIWEYKDNGIQLTFSNEPLKPRKRRS